MGKKHICFFQTAETGNRAPNSGVKGSGANYYPRAPAQFVLEQGYSRDDVGLTLVKHWVDVSCLLVAVPRNTFPVDYALGVGVGDLGMIGRRPEAVPQFPASSLPTFGKSPGAGIDLFKSPAQGMGSGPATGEFRSNVSNNVPASCTSSCLVTEGQGHSTAKGPCL